MREFELGLLADKPGRIIHGKRSHLVWAVGLLVGPLPPGPVSPSL
jgi:hypothetical protein